MLVCSDLLVARNLEPKPMRKAFSLVSRVGFGAVRTDTEFVTGVQVGLDYSDTYAHIYGLAHTPRRPICTL